MAVALDSNVVIGFLDGEDPFHRAADARIRELLTAGTVFVTSVVTYAEVLAGAKLGHQDESVVRGFFEDLIASVTPADRDVAERAAELRAQHSGLRMPDALILAGADLHPDVDRLICSDQLAARAAGSLEVEVEALRPNG